MRLSLLIIAAMAVLSTASAAVYNVGEPGGAWDLTTNYSTWAFSRKFQLSDQIVFKYSPQAHDVLEVSKADYDSCSIVNPIATLNSGNDIVTLTAAGTRYFICGFPGHCTGGMKIKIDVVPSSSSPSPAPASGPNASNAPPTMPVSTATSVKATGFGLAILLAFIGFMA
ncbi:mavicyanin-like [Triticum urartu]|uniref:Phytocyanin domain-containing protein n=2 Tax=Triticum urartu TaxID=4572 RepID=A0A8R7VFE8_TRIUA|nr:mavicyanin-like [Triticum urartu]